MGAMSRALLTVLVFAVAAGCSPPPSPSAATEALESALLTADEIGGGFAEDSRGGVGVGGWGVCPESDARFGDVGSVRVRFTREVGDDAQIEVVQTMYVVDGDIDTLMADLKAAYEVCDGLVWTDYGEKKTVTTVTAPDIGDDSFAVAFPPAEFPDKGTYDFGRTVYVAAGDVLMEISCWETLEGEPPIPITSDGDLYRIATQAVASLSG